MRVTLLRTRTTQTIASTFQHAKASGAFLVVTLRVTNHTVTPQRLNPYRQARLRIAGGEYSVSFAGQSADAGDEAWQKKIGSEKSRTADLVFELPRAALQETSARVVLQFTNFGEVLPGQTSEVGLIYLGAGSQVRTQPHATQITDGWRSARRSLDLGGAYRRETSSATISAAGCRCLASATLCPAHSDSASISPVVPTSGGAGEYRTIGFARSEVRYHLALLPVDYLAPAGPRPPTSRPLSCGGRGEERPAIPPHRGWRTTLHRSRSRRSGGAGIPRGSASRRPGGTGCPARRPAHRGRARPRLLERRRSHRPR